jgi:hypothetical protein
MNKWTLLYSHKQGFTHVESLEETLAINAEQKETEYHVVGIYDTYQEASEAGKKFMNTNIEKLYFNPIMMTSLGLKKQEKIHKERKNNITKGDTNG